VYHAKVRALRVKTLDEHCTSKVKPLPSRQDISWKSCTQLGLSQALSLVAATQFLVEN
jgi:hypothetical protein